MNKKVNSNNVSGSPNRKTRGPRALALPVTNTTWKCVRMMEIYFVQLDMLRKLTSAKSQARRHDALGQIPCKNSFHT